MRLNVIVCERCGKKLEKYSEFRNKKDRWLMEFSFWEDGDETMKFKRSYDFCNKCIKGITDPIMKFINEYNKDYVIETKLRKKER